MFQTSDRRKTGVTLVELVVGAAILAVIFAITARWFFVQREYQQRLSGISDIQDDFRRTSWAMIQELQMARLIVWPRLNADRSIHSDTKLVFKDFNGQIIAYYHVPATRELRRCVIPNGPGDPVFSAKPIGEGIASITFTAGSMDNRLISFHMSTKGVHSLDAVYLTNTD
ncbi:MAG TPA: prepilin-type N-terminal cleavage/methylation domain-containing protein [Candidatus Ozemobacteraceae bacterium]|nr:prepilin-type N-terminal cleavage/methylation domain-containing protein [Candidatus Ozemobacteraceae bacterium]